MHANKEETAARRTGVLGRWWFAGIGAFYLLIALVGFIPQAISFATRDIDRPIELHVHGVIMGLFMIAFIAQAVLAGRGDVMAHRRRGVFAAILGVTAWISMLVVLDSAMRRDNPFQLPFLPNVLTLGLLQSVVFIALFGAAILVRNVSAWHRRLLTFAVLVTLLAALQRMPWLPVFPLREYWAHGIWLYVLAAPIVVFDIATLRRLHLATLTGLGIVTLYIAVLSFLWDNVRYKTAFLEVWQHLYGS